MIVHLRQGVPEVVNKISGARRKLSLLVKGIPLKLLSHYILSTDTKLPVSHALSVSAFQSTRLSLDLQKFVASLMTTSSTDVHFGVTGCRDLPFQ